MRAAGPEQEAVPPIAKFSGQASRRTLSLVTSINEHEPRPLTARERELLQCIADGYSTKQVAERLGMAFRTATCHRDHIMHKLGVHDAMALVRYAIRTSTIRIVS